MASGRERPTGRCPGAVKTAEGRREIAVIRVERSRPPAGEAKRGCGWEKYPATAPSPAGPSGPPQLGTHRMVGTHRRDSGRDPRTGRRGSVRRSRPVFPSSYGGRRVRERDGPPVGSELGVSGPGPPGSPQGYRRSGGSSVMRPTRSHRMEEAESAFGNAIGSGLPQCNALPTRHVTCGRSDYVPTASRC